MQVINTLGLNKVEMCLSLCQAMLGQAHARLPAAAEPAAIESAHAEPAVAADVTGAKPTGKSKSRIILQESSMSSVLLYRG